MPLCIALAMRWWDVNFWMAERHVGDERGNENILRYVIRMDYF